MLIAKGWANPWHKSPDGFRQTWHFYPAPTDSTASACGQWGYDSTVDHALFAQPPESAAVCRTCLRMTTKEPANATP